MMLVILIYFYNLLADLTALSVTGSVYQNLKNKLVTTAYGASHELYMPNKLFIFLLIAQCKYLS